MIRPYSKEERQYVKYLVSKHARKPFWKRRIFSYLLIIVIAILCLSIVLVAFPLENNHYIPSSTLDAFGWSEIKVIDTAQEVIKEQLLFPSSAQFSNIQATLESQNISFNEYIVKGKVSSLNTYGLTITKSFFLKLRCYSDSVYSIVESE